MISYTLNQSVAPTIEPVTVAEFRRHAHIEIDETAITFTDLASTLASGWLTVTSVTGGFTGTADEELVITSGTNFIPGRYSVSAVTDDNTITVVPLCGSVGNAEDGIGYIPTETDELTAIVRGAREHFERICKRSFLTQTWQMRMRSFPGWEIEVPMPPLQSVTSIAYTDTNGDAQTVDASDYIVDIYGILGRIEPAFGETWPVARDIPNSVVVTFVAGYGDAASDVPEDLKRAIKLLGGTMYNTRESSGVLPSRSEVAILGGDVTVQRLAAPFMVRSL